MKKIVSYDIEADTLYIGDMKNTFGDEDKFGIIVFFDEKSRKRKAFTVMDFKELYESGKIFEYDFAPFDFEQDILPEAKKLCAFVQ